MSKPSTASLSKISTQLPQKSAWAKGPPQNTSAPSPRSQSPAPSVAPQPTHSRRPSALSGGPVHTKDGVSIPRNNVGAVKPSSAVTFGSIDDASAPISSSPTAAPTIKSENVKSFGTLPAQANIGTINGKPSMTKPTVASGPTASTSAAVSSPSPSSSTPPPTKISKVDVRKLFQTASSPAPPSQPETPSPSQRTSNLPPQSSQPPPNGGQPPSQPSPMGAHPYPPPFVPQNGMRPPPQPNTGGPPPRSPVYSRQPMANGNGPRPSNGPNGPGAPSQMPSGMGSPRMSQHPQPGMPAPGMPPAPMQQPMWQGYYYPGMPPDAQFVPYQHNWYGMPPQHGMPPPNQSMGPPPVPAPHNPIPISPRNHPIPIHSGPGTPTPAAAVPTGHHQAPSLQHTHSTASSGLASPPPTPSSVRLNTNANAFVPGNNPRKPGGKISLKSADGTEINLEKFKQNQTPSSVASTPSVTSSPLPNPGHVPRKSVQIRMESEEDKKKRMEEVARLKAESEEKERKAKEEQARKEEEVENERKRKEEEERLRVEQLKKEEEAKAEAERKEKEEKERKEREEKARKEQEEKDRLEKERLEREKEEQARKAEEEARLKKEQEAAAASITSTVQTDEPATIEEEEEGEVQEISKPDELAAADASPSKDKKESLRIDTAPSEPLRRRPGPLDLSGAFKPNIPSALPSALATARIIDDINRIQYPDNIQSPKLELNVHAKDGKFRYDRDFLLQFMSICKEKPDNLPPLDAIGIGPADQNAMTRTSSRGGTHRSGRTPSISSASGAGGGFPFSGKTGPGYSGMGNFGSTGKTSQERYEMANAMRAASGSGIPPFGRPAPMTRTSSQPGISSGLSNNKRTRSKRGETRDKNSSGSQHNSNFSTPLENVAPLQVTANRWDRKALGGIDPDSPEIVDRKVKSLLNKLSMEKFDSISDQIIEWANKSEKEKDGRTLIQVIRLVFEKATDEATWSEMYARLCRKMMEQISPKVQDDGIKNADGKPIAGGQLFRKYLLNRCQEDFERGWVAKEATAAAAATKALEDKAKETAVTEAGTNPDEIVLYSDEYYAAQKAKRQGLGLIKFIGELFKLQMLTERIMHECIKKLLGNVENPEEEEIESLCKLISTVGQLLDSPKAKAHMDVYFSRMKELGKSNSVSSRMQFMLQDVIELRDRKWTTRSQMAPPSTISQVRDGGAKDLSAADKDANYRQASMSRGGSRRGGDRNGEFAGPGPDGWTNVSNTPRLPSKAGDLSNFGKISSGGKGLPATFGPSNVFSGRSKESKRESASVSRASSMSSNMFSMLSQSESAEVKAATPEPPAQRRKLVLAPRTKPTEGSTAEATPVGSDDGSEDEESAAPQMDEAAANTKISEDLKEFFAVKNLDEAEVYFTALPPVHHHLLVEKLAGKAVESKPADAQLVADLFVRVSEKNLCTLDAFEEGLAVLVEILEDIAIDAPKAPNNMAAIIKSIPFDADRRTELANKSMEPEKLLELLA